jgi:CBS domain-containing protein
MSVLELCDREIAAVELNASVAEAIHKMLDHHVGAVAVVDTEYRVAGIFTERDVLRKLSLSRLDPQTTSVRDLMTTPVEMATLGTGAGEALTIMLERHFRHLPVADDNGKLLGILSIRNLLEWRVDDLSRELESLEQYVSNDGPGG